MLETLTIALGAETRSAGSSASVRRTTASKLTAIVRRTFSQPTSANRPPPGGAGVVDEQVEAAVVALRDGVRDACRRIVGGQVDGEPARAALAKLAGQGGEAVLATGHEQDVRGVLADEGGGRWPSPIPLEAPVTTAIMR